MPSQQSLAYHVSHDRTKSVRLLLLPALIVAALTAQTIDTGILRNITDPSGAVIAGATITITKIDTGVKRATQSAADGKYEVRYLVPGEHNVEVQAQGFRTARASNLVIRINQQARLDIPGGRLGG